MNDEYEKKGIEIAYSLACDACGSYEHRKLADLIAAELRESAVAQRQEYHKAMERALGELAKAENRANEAENRGMERALRIVEDHWARPEGYDQLCDAIRAEIAKVKP